jgi:hypothetical protein
MATLARLMASASPENPSPMVLPVEMLKINVTRPTVAPMEFVLPIFSRPLELHVVTLLILSVTNPMFVMEAENVFRTLQLQELSVAKRKPLACMLTSVMPMASALSADPSLLERAVALLAARHATPTLIRVMEPANASPALLLTELLVEMEKHPACLPTLAPMESVCQRPSLMELPVETPKMNVTRWTAALADSV